jgi:hypothetical protein
MGMQFGATFTPPMLMSLVGYLAYGLITGLVYAGYVRTRSVRGVETTVGEGALIVLLLMKGRRVRTQGKDGP